MFSLKEKEVNTGRQRELDLVKGFLNVRKMTLVIRENEIFILI